MTIQHDLKDREIEILRLMADGLTNREIAEQLFIGVETVRWYAKQIYSKLHVSGREEASIRAAELGLITNIENLTLVPKHNLPTQITTFVGRDTELSELDSVLSKSETRLLTVLAPGGMGKTRLCLELASHLAETRAYLDGVYFVPLQPISDLEYIVTHILAQIGFQLAHDNRNPKEQLLTYLANKQMLLLIDNWEHLLDAAPIVTDILEAAPQVKILATSREKLRLGGEVVYALQGMQFPEWETPDDALEYDAVKLLTQAAQRVKPDWEVTESNLDFVARICRITQGMPLGILLAAGWLDVYSLERIAEEIQKNVDFLETELRDTPERQRSVRAVFEWTWERLKANEQDVFMKLSVFHDGCTPEAAETITGANGRILQSLVNRALLHRDKDGRYSIHELLRQYGEVQLQKSEEIYLETRNTHCGYYIERIEDISLRFLEGAGSIFTIAEAELDNLYAAWSWTIETYNEEAMMTSMAHFAFIHYWLGRFADGILALENAIQAIENSSGNQHLLAGLLASQAFLSSYHLISEHSLSKAKQLFEAIDISQVSPPMLYSYYYVPMAQRYSAPYEAIEGFKAFLEIVEMRKFKQTRSLNLYLKMTVWQIANVYCEMLDDTKNARLYAEEVERHYRELEKDLGVAIALYLLAKIEYREGNTLLAKKYCQDAIATHRTAKERYNFANALVFAGRIALDEKEYEQARLYCAEALHLIKGFGPTNNLYNLLVTIASLLLAKEEAHRAAELTGFIIEYKSKRQDFIRGLAALQEKLQAILSDADYQAALKAGQSLSFEAIIIDLSAELEE